METMMKHAKKRILRKVVLAVDVGGSHVKVMTNKGLTKREFPSGQHLSAKKMVREVKRLTKDWSYDVVTRDPLLIADPWRSRRGWSMTP